MTTLNEGIVLHTANRGVRCVAKSANCRIKLTDDSTRERLAAPARLRDAFCRKSALLGIQYLIICHVPQVKLLLGPCRSPVPRRKSQPHCNHHYIRPMLTMQSLLTVPTALLLVGEQRTSFHVHQSLLIAYSRFFFSNLTAGFEETTTQTVTLPEEDVETVDLIVHWIYYRLRWPLSCLSNDRFMQLAHLYAFADRLRLVGLMDDVVLELFESSPRAVWLLY